MTRGSRFLACGSIFATVLLSACGGSSGSSPNPPDNGLPSGVPDQVARLKDGSHLLVALDEDGNQISGRAYLISGSGEGRKREVFRLKGTQTGDHVEIDMTSLTDPVAEGPDYVLTGTEDAEGELAVSLAPGSGAEGDEKEAQVLDFEGPDAMPVAKPRSRAAANHLLATVWDDWQGKALYRLRIEDNAPMIQDNGMIRYWEIGYRICQGSECDARFNKYDRVIGWAWVGDTEDLWVQCDSDGYQLFTLFAPYAGDGKYRFDSGVHGFVEHPPVDGQERESGFAKLSIVGDPVMLP